MDKLTLYAAAGTGSAIVEAALAIAARDYARIDIPYGATGPDLTRLAAINPVGQLPALELPSGVVMTESAAIILYLAENAPEAGLAPPVGDVDRPRFLRWLLFFVSNIYPSFTYADFPERWVSGDGAQTELVARIEHYREKLWAIVDREAAAGATDASWFLGPRFSALDLYIWVMTHWRPRRGWFAENCPKLAAIAAALDKDGRLDCVRLRNSSDSAG